MTTALVLGGAESLWTDINAALAIGEFAGVVTCNDATAAYPGRINAAASLHPERWPLWLTRRARKGFAEVPRVISHLEAQASQPPISRGVTDFTEFRFNGQTTTGSSGLFALKVALEDLGFDRAVLCGVPMDIAGHFNNAADVFAANHYRAGWIESLPHIAGRARSMSGWTADLLGLPDARWIGEH